MLILDRKCSWLSKASTAQVAKEHTFIYCVSQKMTMVDKQ